MLEQIAYALFRRDILNKLESGHYAPEHCFWKEENILKCWEENISMRSDFLVLAREALRVLEEKPLSVMPNLS